VSASISSVSPASGEAEKSSEVVVGRIMESEMVTMAGATK